MLSDSPVTITTTQISRTSPNTPTRLILNLQTKSQYSETKPGKPPYQWNKLECDRSITPNIAECLNNTVYANGTTSSRISSGCNGTDITLTVVKNGVKSLDHSVVYSNVNLNTNYSINLLDPAYGLQSAITYPETITYYGQNMANLSATTATAQYIYQNSSYSYSVPLGSLTYTARNNYWISQSYYYQMGGVFPLSDRWNNVQTAPRRSPSRTMETTTSPSTL